MTWTTILGGVVGSHAYGLNTPTSDVDRLQFAVAPTTDFHGLSLPIGKDATHVAHDPDVTVHEVGKAVSLLLKCNPTVTELLYLNEWETADYWGLELLDIRESFLSARAVRNAYFGYATQQFQRLANKGRFPDVSTGRIEKHARHLLRLINQGTRLWLTGTLTVLVEDPQRYFEFGARVVHDTRHAKRALDDAEEIFNTYSTSLPQEPDRREAEIWLKRVRADFFRMVDE